MPVNPFDQLNSTIKQNNEDATVSIRGRFALQILTSLIQADHDLGVVVGLAISLTDELLAGLATTSRPVATSKFSHADSQLRAELPSQVE